jgi:hypothetical protein
MLVVACTSILHRIAFAQALLRRDTRLQPVKGLMASLGILAYLCAVGVAWPLALLPVAEDNQQWKLPILVLLLLGLGALLILFGLQIRAARTEV